MVVRKYIPDKMMGFVSDGEADLFFHVGTFRPGEERVSPIVGEKVEVSIDESREKPRVLVVQRLQQPIKRQGKITKFNREKGFGFIQDVSGDRYYLHKSEMVRGFPVVGRTVEFFVGTDRRHFLRACYVQNTKK